MILAKKKDAFNQIKSRCGGCDLFRNTFKESHEEIKRNPIYISQRMPAHTPFPGDGDEGEAIN